MQVGFAWLDTQLDTAARQLMGLSSLDIVSVGTRLYLIAAGEADGGLSSYEILTDGTLVASNDVLFGENSGTGNVRFVNAYIYEGSAYVIPSGRYDDNLAVYQLDASGVFTTSQTLSGSGTANLTMSEVVTAGSNSYLFSANTSAGLDRFTIAAGGALTNQSLIADNASVALGDVTAMTSGLLKGRDFLFVASSFDAGLSVFEVGGNGGLNSRTLLTPDITGFNAISAMATAEIAERAFLLVGSSETDTLMVLRVSVGGRLNLVDQLVDKSETRFARISEIEVFEYEGRTFVLAAGSDDGVTLFELTYRGRLNLLGVVADEFTTTLDNISDIKVEIIDSDIFVFVASPTESGFTQFQLTLNPGTTYMGGPVAETITGSTGDDTIFGMGMNDVLNGRAGNDRLIDGRGRDVLTGGTGADIFEFIADGRRDIITDFEQGIDRIDFTDYPALYSYLDLDIRARPDGAVIRIGTEKLWITSVDGQPIDPSTWVQEDFIFS
ncbi:MAG: hypothetical protein L3J37_12320 [Rhodobacteraceae bacterium]|nr:hypothetical protein [Paracoccaceae bacterium]